MEEQVEVVRLKRFELFSLEYRNLIEGLFSKESIDQRLSYSKWIFQDNPFAGSTDELPIYICLVNQQYVGQLAIIPIDVCFGGKETRSAGWCADYFINPNFQRRGIGDKLLKAAQKDFPLLMTLGQTDASFNLFHAKLGWHFNGSTLTLYRTFLRPGLLGKYLAKKIGLVNARISAPLALSETMQGNHCEFTLLNSFKEKQDEWQDLNRDGSGTSFILRTIEFMEWRYFQHPFINYNVHYLKLADGQIMFFVWRLGQDDYWQRAEIIDVLYSSEISVGLLQKAFTGFMECLSAYGMEICECKTSDPKIINALPKSFLSSEKPGARFLYGTTEMAECPDIPIDKWQLFAGDCDVEALTF